MTDQTFHKQWRAKCSDQ